MARLCINITGQLHHSGYVNSLTRPRVSGYLIILFSLATIAAATFTDFNENVLHVKLWAVIVAAVLLLAGLLSRVKKHKLGL